MTFLYALIYCWVSGQNSGKNWPLIHHWWDSELVEGLWQNTMEMSKKIEKDLER